MSPSAPLGMQPPAPRQNAAEELLSRSARPRSPPCRHKSALEVWQRQAGNGNVTVSPLGQGTSISECRRCRGGSVEGSQWKPRSRPLHGRESPALCSASAPPRCQGSWKRCKHFLGLNYTKAVGLRAAVIQVMNCKSGATEPTGHPPVIESLGWKRLPCPQTRPHPAPAPRGTFGWRGGDGAGTCPPAPLWVPRFGVSLGRDPLCAASSSSSAAACRRPAIAHG